MFFVSKAVKLLQLGSKSTFVNARGDDFMVGLFIKDGIFTYRIGLGIYWVR